MASDDPPIVTSPRIVRFADLASTDLHRDTIYEGGTAGHYGDEPIHHMLPVGNQGGIRYAGPADRCRLVVLFSILDHQDWPDHIDEVTGVVTYYGDNRDGARAALDQKGNRAVREIFRRGFATREARAECPPFLLFTRADEPGLPKRSQRFRGLAVPGAIGVPPEDWLVMKWFETPSGGFENYQLTLTLLNAPTVPRRWIDDVLAGRTASAHCPPQYAKWVREGLR